MTGPLPEDDLDLLTELGTLLRRCDPVPAELVAAATAAFALATPPACATVRWPGPAPRPACRS